jgi:hypothetical protein
MTISGVYGGAGLAAVQYPQFLHRPGGAGSPIDISETVSTSPQASAAPTPAQNGFSAMLGNMSAGGFEEFDTGPSPNQYFAPPASGPQASSGQDTFGGDLLSLLQSVFSGDMASAQATAGTMEPTPGASSPQSGGSPGSENSTAAAASSASTAPTAPNAPAAPSPAAADSAQSTFMADLGNLLSAVQSGDASASQTAAAALIDHVKSQADAFRTQLASLLTPSDAA